MPTGRGLMAIAIACWGSLLSAKAAGYDGAALFASKCADCHGETGQGTDYHRPMLAGDLPISELARVISETMPEGDPESCVGAEAEAIARYVHAAFYSPLAQARIRPPRRELSRLTVRQFEQSLADLFAEFRWRKPIGEARGLKATFRKRIKTTAVEEPQELVLPGIDFLLSELSALPEGFRDPAIEVDHDSKKQPVDIDVQINGALLAPASGEYEFIVDSKAGVELTVNGRRVIDAKVRSDDDSEVRGSTRLVGGRVYPLSLRSARTRADDLRLSLRWRPPGGREATIPARRLFPEHFPAVYATTARFPADDRSVGYVRGANVSAAWHEATTTAAVEAVQTVLDDLPAYLSNNEGQEPAGLNRGTVVAFCERFASIAFRRPLSDGERQRFVETFFSQPEPTETLIEERPLAASVELSLLSILKSPRFLYPEAALLDAPAERRDDHAVATRLALGLWDSLPDPHLRDAATEGWLHHRDAAYEQAQRLLADRRARSKLGDFFEHWLRFDHVSQLSRDPAAFPDFTDEIAADMRTSLDLFLEEVVWNGDADLRELFLSQELYVNKRLAGFLGVEFDAAGAEGDDPEAFFRARVDSPERAGVVSHPFIVTAFSYYRDTSPIHRGVFLARNVLGRSLRPPPEAVAPLAPELAPEMTTRERVAAQTSPGACQACHVLINDLGFTLEHFDAVGRFRDTDRDRPIDASGGYIATDGGTVRLAGARDLANFLANSEDVHRSFVTQLFEHVTKQPMLAYGLDTRERLLADFRAGGFNIRDLLCDIAVTAALAD